MNEEVSKRRQEGRNGKREIGRERRMREGVSQKGQGGDSEGDTELVRERGREEGH